MKPFKMADPSPTTSVQTKSFPAQKAFAMITEASNASWTELSSDESSHYSNSDKDPDYMQDTTSDSSLSDEGDNNTNTGNTDESVDRHGNDGQVEGVTPKKRSRRPTRSPKEWKQNKRKRQRNSGQEYTTKSGKLVHPKTMNPLHNHKCRLNCNLNISFKQREEIFKAFWALGCFDAQNSFISACVTQKKTQRARDRKVNDVSRRQITRDYKLHVADETVKVCKSMFLATLGVSNGRCSRILEKIKQQECHIAAPDKRGKHNNHKKHDDMKIQEIKDHIKSFPAYTSHYARAKHADSKRYLSPDLNIAKMYELYHDQQISEEKTPLKQSFYRHIFNHFFNISFHTPRQDTCKTCDNLNTKIYAATATEDARQTLKHQLEYHHRVAEKARTAMKEDAEEAKLDAQKEVFTFDLEKTLPTPRIPTGVAYYKRQLWTYNLGVHSLTSGKGFMYVWHEGQAKRGACEVGSCLYKYIDKICAEGIKSFTAYSDCCGGQNRNFKIAMIWSHIVLNTSIEEINHKIMEPGHSFLPNDQDFGIIEKKKLNVETVFTPDCWVKLITNCKKRNPFVVHQMSGTDFKNPEWMKKWMVNRKKDRMGQKVAWLKIKWMKFQKTTPFTMFFKNTLCKDLEFNSVEMGRYKPTRQKPNPSEAAVAVLPTLYESEKVPINPKKYEDLMELLAYVPPIHHNFYTNLCTSETVTLNHPDDAGLDLAESEEEDDADQ